MDIIGIYKITCIENNKIYIGSSRHIQKRIKNHFNKLKAGKHINPHIQSTYNLYGYEKFKWEILEECLIDELLNREQYWIDLTQCFDRNIGFNNCKKADRPLGYKHTESARKKMSESKKNKKLTDDHINKIAIANKGKKRTAEQKEKMSQAKLGIKNPMFGKKEDENHKIKRMEKMLSTPRWNKGLTKKTDPRIAKLATQTGKIPHNALKCILVNLVTNEIWLANSLKELANKSPLSLSTINRLKNNQCGKKIKEIYQLKYES
jgi:group I intron endonuclease